MRIQHIACNVGNPDAVAAWYCEHQQMRVVKRIDDVQRTGDSAAAS